MLFLRYNFQAMIQLEPTFRKEKKYYVTGMATMKNMLHRPLNLADSSAVFICRSGQAVVNIYFKNYLFRKDDILILSLDMIAIFLRVSEDFSVFYCMMSQPFESEVSYNLPITFFDLLYLYPVLQTNPEQARTLSAWQEQVEWFEKENIHPHSRTIMRNYLESLYLTIHYELQKIEDNPERVLVGSGEKILQEFFYLVAKYASKHRNVAYYAGELCITPYYLSTITIKYMKESPKEIIDAYVILELKKLAETTSLPVKMIAEQLNFEDTSYMGRFFRRHTGMSLTEYRKNHSI